MSMLGHVGGYLLTLGSAEPGSQAQRCTAFKEVSMASAKPKGKL